MQTAGGDSEEGVGEPRGREPLGLQFLFEAKLKVTDGKTTVLLRCLEDGITNRSLLVK